MQLPGLNRLSSWHAPTNRKLECITPKCGCILVFVYYMQVIKNHNEVFCCLHLCLLKVCFIFLFVIYVQRNWLEQFWTTWLTVFAYYWHQKQGRLLKQLWALLKSCFPPMKTQFWQHIWKIWYGIVFFLILLIIQLSFLHYLNFSKYILITWQLKEKVYLSIQAT